MKYSAIIPTLGRPDSLSRTLAALAAQSDPPEEVIVVDGLVPYTTALPIDSSWPFPVIIHPHQPASAAGQRNAGVSHTRPSNDLLLFIDDDIVPAHESCHLLVKAMGAPDLGAVAARMEGARHKPPKGILRCYYRLQAGYSHHTYGGQIFGPAISCLPCYTHDEVDAGLIPAGWLPSGMLMVRRVAFEQVKGFPAFEGYSALEDVYMSAAIARAGHRLVFHPDARFEHLDPPSPARRDRAALARMRLANRRLVAAEFLDLHGPAATFKFFLLRLFDTLAILRQRPPGWPSELRGTWLP